MCFFSRNNRNKCEVQTESSVLICLKTYKCFMLLKLLSTSYFLVNAYSFFFFSIFLVGLVYFMSARVSKVGVVS